jgi:hypothetical protein
VRAGDTTRTTSGGTSPKGGIFVDYKALQGSAQSLHFQIGRKTSVDFALSFSEQAARPFVLRLTGGCANMTAADAIGMRNLADALRGFKGSKDLPRFEGFALFGGTQMISIHDPAQVVPGITEIFPSIAQNLPGLVMLGIVPGFRQLLVSKEPGLIGKNILDIQPKKGVITTVHPDLRSVLLVEPEPNNEEIWDDEWKECARYIRTLHERNWKSLLIVYNGGSVSERELKFWAQAGRQEPGRWNVLLIKESGRIADQYAEDQAFLDEHPGVFVAENDVEHINETLYKLDALVPVATGSGDSGKVIPLRRAS